MIQSTYPLSISGMSAAIPSPAGVSAPVSVIPTVTSASSILRVKRRQASRSRAALYARNALSIRSAAVSAPLIGFGSMRSPRKNLERSCDVCLAPARSRSSAARFWSPLGPAALGRLAGILRLPRLDHRVRGFLRIVGEQNKIQVPRRDLGLAKHSRLDPTNQPGPVVSSEHDDGKLVNLARLNERERLECFIERAEAAGKDDEGVRVLDEHRLSHEEVAKVDERIDVRVRALLERELDVAADRRAAGHLRALVRRLHDSGPGAGDDREPRLGEQACHFLRGLILRVVGVRPRRPED